MFEKQKHLFLAPGDLNWIFLQNNFEKLCINAKFSLYTIEFIGRQLKNGILDSLYTGILHLTLLAFYVCIESFQLIISPYGILNTIC